MRVAAPLLITAPSGALRSVLFSAPYNQTLTSTGGNAPIAWSLASGQLPPGITLSTAGILNGSSTSIGLFSFAVKAADSSSPQQPATVSSSISLRTSLQIGF